MNRAITIGVSPCPNDTFIFGAMLRNDIDLSGLSFEPIFEDVEYLNKAAANAELDVVKVSYFAYSNFSEKYQILPCGGALGKNCGPLLLSAKANAKPKNDSLIAIPGENTTAHLLLQIAYSDCHNKVEVLFSDIEQGLLDGKYEFGLVIHESRFTYASRGLYKVVDLGEYWESTTQCPLPLGAICIKRELPEVTKLQIASLIRNSIDYAYLDKGKTLAYAKLYAQDMDEDVMQAHIDLYVNEYSMNLGNEGFRAVAKLFDEVKLKYPGRKLVEPIFVRE